MCALARLGVPFLVGLFCLLRGCAALGVWFGVWSAQLLAVGTCVVVRGDAWPLFSV